MTSGAILVLNSGSSSLKFAALEPGSGRVIAQGIAECLGSAEPTFQFGSQAERALGQGAAHAEALTALLAELKDVSLVAVGHRVVHGGEAFSDSVLLDDAVLQKIRACSELAPLHNPANVLGIEAARRAFAELPQVAVFDTAFHQTLPRAAYLYAIPYEYYQQHQVRRYGFHGTSHGYVAGVAATLLGKPLEALDLITAHLGNGASVCAIANGQSVDTSMGFTPLEGVVMGTRSGDVDPNLHEFLAKHAQLDLHQITEMLNKKSGLLGLSGVSNDMRRLLELRAEGNDRARLAIEVFCYRLAKAILGLCAGLSRLDALVFTGGIGEHSAEVRAQTLGHLRVLGAAIDEPLNRVHGAARNGRITRESSALLALVVPTNEELVIARETARLTLPLSPPLPERNEAMPHTLYLVPCGSGVGLTSLALGLVRALDNRGTRVAFFKPIAQPDGHDSGPERSTHFIRHTSSLKPSTPISLEEASRLILTRRTDELYERVLRDFHASSGDADVVVVEGLAHTHDALGEGSLNRELVRTLSAEVILVGSLDTTPLAEFESHLEIAAGQYGGFGPGRVIGCFVNRVPVRDSRVRTSLYGDLKPGMLHLSKPEFNVIGAIPENPELTACRTIDIARQLGAEIVHEGEIKTRRAKKITMLARTVPNLVDTLVAGSILVTPGDRADVVLAVALAAINKVPISGLILTGGIELPPAILELCRAALETGLPVLKVQSNTWETANQLARMSPEIPIDDLERVLRGMDFVASHINTDWIAAHSQIPIQKRVSPAAFCYRLTELAHAVNKRIVLPEGNEPRTVRAAAICAERGIARCVLLGDPAEVRRVAQAQEVELPPEVEIVDPVSIRANYVAPLVEMRKHKGLSALAAAESLEDNVWLGTMMLALGEVDGLVSGAVHSTANTIRPALQLIKTKPGAKVVSSIFFMCLPEQVLVYGDCAVIPDPDAAMLADIAIQSADSAARFGITPSVAMISYSTGESGSGSDVDKVREATRIAQAARPDLSLDGPLQYDAAAIPDVAASKAPDSPVAGHATVFIFPDLNTGNTTYKAVQRSANVISIGPMLQGLRRPVNDLSRGALVEDIVYTIALTAIQAGQS